MLTISTFNIQNDINNFSHDKTEQIINYIKEYKIDVLNLQEVYSKVNDDLIKELKKMNYISTGNYRFLLRKTLNKINEKNSIITNHKVLYTRTYHLPFMPSLLKRIITKTVIDYEGEKVSIYNTHLDFMYTLSKKRQLKRILSILKKDKNKIILTGDFNLKDNKEIFQEFIKELEILGIKHININEKTFKPSRYHRAIDHIFISEEFKLVSKKLITDIETSDHYPVLIKIK